MAWAEKSVRAHLEEHEDIQTGRAIALVWTIHDILGLEGPHGPYPLTEDQAIHILRSIERNHDASLGVSWDTLQDAVHDYLVARGIDPMGFYPGEEE